MISNKNRFVKNYSFNFKMQAGTHEIKVNVSNAIRKLVPSGIYLLRMEAGNYLETKKLSVIK